MLYRAALLSLLIVSACQAMAEECRLDHATYRESVSGATIAFRPKDRTKDAALTVALFRLHLPNVREVFEGDVTWNAGGNARPDGEIGRACSEEEKADASACWLWTGNAYGLGDASARLLDDAGMMAPKAILLADFGRSLSTSEVFARANPDSAAFDLFTLTGCGK